MATTPRTTATTSTSMRGTTVRATTTRGARGARGDGTDAQGWQPQPLAGAIISDLVEDLCKRLPSVAALGVRLRQESGIRLIDLVDAIVVRGTPGLSDRLRRSGFTLQPRRGADICFSHGGGSFPDLILVPEPMLSVFIAVESVADFCAAHGLDGAIEGEPGAPYRRVQAYGGEHCALWVVERHGYDGFQVTDLQPRYALDCQRVRERFRTRRRLFANDLDGFDHAENLITQANLAVGRDMACELFFQAEREYWQRRNAAGRLQKARQDLLGLGWANHDHHTYRSSRACFLRLIQLLELLGLQCRERFYPGAQAGWGAQILEHPVTGIVVFADVDMSPQEAHQDFAHQGLPPGTALGTVGLWCALHGEAFLEAGMHHLEALFAFSDLTAQLSERGVEMMPAFTDFPHLRQAFTVGERWVVRRERVMRLLAGELIDAHQARSFLDAGVLGSHLENLERNDGFKGFNQSGVDHIIRDTDPRTAPLQPPGAQT
jgi:hypothetical protein